MNSQELLLKNTIMQRVRFIYGIKSLPRVFIPKIAVLSSLIAVAGFFVSFPNVINNMPSLFEMSKLFEFVSVAFIKTDFIIQIVFLISLSFAIYIAVETIKTFRGVMKYYFISA